jgi:hypothetical protein
VSFVSFVVQDSILVLLGVLAVNLAVNELSVAQKHADLSGNGA